MDQSDLIFLEGTTVNVGSIFILGVLICLVAAAFIYISIAIYSDFSYGRQLRREEDLQLRRADLQIGYKYANIGRKGFLGLASGKSYGLNEELPESEDLQSGLYGFHSYKSLEILRDRSRDEPYLDKGVIVLQVIHYGVVEEYDDGWLSTGQRVLQISPSDQPCFEAHELNCSGEARMIMSFPLNVSFVYCNSHFEAAERKTRWIPGRKVVNIAKWLDSMEKNAGDRIRINRSPSELESIEIG